SPRKGGNLTVDTGPEAIALPGPSQLGGQTTKNLSYNYAETLAYRDAQMKLQPMLATSWKVADDGVTWTFELRKGVKFHDGTPLNSEAVKANVDHWLDPKSQSVVRSTFTRLIESSRVVDDSTVEIKTQGRQAALVGVVAGYDANIVSATQLKNEGQEGVNKK